MRRKLALGAVAGLVAGGLVLAQAGGSGGGGDGGVGGGGDGVGGVGEAGGVGESDLSGVSEGGGLASSFRLLDGGDLVEVRMAGGGTVRGEVQELIGLSESDGAGALAGAVLILEVRGGRESVLLSDASGVEVLETAFERYVERRVALEPGDIEGRVGLIRWLERHGMYEAGLREVELVLESSPGNTAALRLGRLLEAGLALERMRAERDAADEGADGDGGGVARFDGRRLRRPTREELPRLTEREANLVRVYELDLSEDVEVEVPGAVVDELLLRYSASPLVPVDARGREAFRRLPAKEILGVMFRLRARDLYPRVIVKDRPRTLDVFEREVQTRWLVGRCATTRCHGGVDAGRFQVLTTRRAQPGTVTTNFHILDEYVGRDGVTRMLDWEDPDLSLLLQMGLPRDEALYPHPDVAGWRPAFRGREDRYFRRTVGWMGLGVRPRPEYDLAYETPRERWERLREESGAGGGAGGDVDDGEGGGGGDGAGGEGG